KWQPQGLVVGQSVQQDGSDNLVTPRIIKFCRQLHGRFNLPVYQVDETLTTFEAKQMLYNDLNVSAKKLWKVQDQLAAQRILLTWINAQQRPHEP
ncbi:MAG: Holliday junction resolvase RuvX, partial [Methylococcales bacterium]|nr:Holliday junction resolvase RuvX [Methylococcales bacterium]